MKYVQKLHFSVVYPTFLDIRSHFFHMTLIYYHLLLTWVSLIPE